MAEQTEDGSVVIQNVPVRTEDALYFATKDTQHFQDTDLHLRPDQLWAEAEKVQKQKKAESPYLAPKDAYQLVQAGKFSQVKSQKVSEYYTWGDAMVSTSINSQNIKTLPLTVYENVLKHAKVLDRISQDVGQKVPIESWVRIQAKSSYHTRGLANDFRGTKSFLHGPVYAAARRIQGLGIGQSDERIPAFTGLHIDSAGIYAPDRNRPALKGKQFWFIDNGNHPSTGSGYKIIDVLP